MAEGEEKLLKDAKKLPWEDRLAHKNWKVRNEANVDLASVCDSITDPKDPRLREFGEFSLLGFSISPLRSDISLRICFEFGMSFVVLQVTCLERRWRIPMRLCKRRRSMR